MKRGQMLGRFWRGQWQLVTHVHFRNFTHEIRQIVSGRVFAKDHLNTRWQMLFVIVPGSGLFTQSMEIKTHQNTHLFVVYAMDTNKANVAKLPRVTLYQNPSFWWQQQTVHYFLFICYTASIQWTFIMTTEMITSTAWLLLFNSFQTKQIPRIMTMISHEGLLHINGHLWGEGARVVDLVCKCVINPCWAEFI